MSLAVEAFALYSVKERPLALLFSIWPFVAVSTPDVPLIAMSSDSCWRMVEI